MSKRQSISVWDNPIYHRAGSIRVEFDAQRCWYAAAQKVDLDTREVDRRWDAILRGEKHLVVPKTLHLRGQRRIPNQAAGGGVWHHILRPPAHWRTGPVGGSAVQSAKSAEYQLKVERENLRVMKLRLSRNQSQGDFAVQTSLQRRFKQETIPSAQKTLKRADSAIENLKSRPRKRRRAHSR